jgi:hypothetical protein
MEAEPVFKEPANPFRPSLTLLGKMDGFIQGQEHLRRIWGSL